MTIDSICTTCVDAVRVAGYNGSTIFNYKGCSSKIQTVLF